MLAFQVYGYFCKQPIPPFLPHFLRHSKQNEAPARGFRFFQVLDGSWPTRNRSDERLFALTSAPQGGYFPIRKDRESGGTTGNK